MFGKLEALERKYIELEKQLVEKGSDWDLGIVLALVSSYKNRPVSEDVLVFGEVGLSGEIRPVSQTERRVAEAARLGFSTIYVSSYGAMNHIPENIRVVKVPDVPALCRTLFRSGQ